MGLVGGNFFKFLGPCHKKACRKWKDDVPADDREYSGNPKYSWLIFFLFTFLKDVPTSYIFIFVILRMPINRNISSLFDDFSNVVSQNFLKRFHTIIRNSNVKDF